MSEVIVQMGYYPDRFAMHELPPDVFFMHVETGEMFEDDDLGLVVENLVAACVEKYHLTYPPLGAVGIVPFLWADTFWSCSPRGER